MPERVVIFGSRFNRRGIPPETVRKARRMTYRAVAELPEGTIVVNGMAPNGVDFWAENAAVEMGYDVERYFADWDTHGKAAGSIRNGVMAKVADRGVGIWDGRSRGTNNMAEQLKRLGKPVEVRRV